MSAKRWTVIATGRTFGVKEDLKSWGFRWAPDRAAWVCQGASMGECNLFRHNTGSGLWEDVILELIEERQHADDRQNTEG